MVTSMKTSLTLFAAAALLVLTARPALADDDYHGGARWGRDQSHYRGSDYHGYRDRDDYRPRVEEHHYIHYYGGRPVRYYRPAYYHYPPVRHYYYYRDDDHDHHHHHDNRDLLAIIGGAILVTEIIRD